MPEHYRIDKARIGAVALSNRGAGRRFRASGLAYSGDKKSSAGARNIPAIPGSMK
jgi:hypothetical protein